MIPRLFSILCCAIIAMPFSPAKAAGRRIEMLFLGDQGHHKPSERFFQLTAALGTHGMDFTYTESLADLNPATLNKYDGLVIYANHPALAPEQEKALVDYVESGHGFVPIHCASACFGNSPAYIALVGGCFKSHETGEFETNIAAPDHPIMKGFPGFKTWDETYAHDQLSNDRTVLQTRGDEPWTWVRTQGKGRVFYTAYGHDERTWGNPGFQELLRRGILWAIGDQAAQQLAALDIKPFEYDSTKNVPNYEKRTPAPLYQLPVSPEESRKHMQIPVDAELSLFASEPGIVNVIDMDWDERGRLWVVETVDYPNDRVDEGGHDRIRILEDTHGDGKLDKATVFADGLSIPTSLCFANGGIIVQQAPHTLFLRDTKGTGHADERKILFSGWGTRDTHAGPSNLHLGFDGWVYGCVGYSGFDGEVGGEHLKFSQGFYRFKPDGSKLEYLGRTSNNTWGFTFNENGDIFGSTANNQHSVYMPISNHYYSMVDGLETPIIPGIDENKKAPLLMERIRQVDVQGGFTAEAGHNLYTARSFPKDFWNRAALICEPTCHILYKGIVEQDGTAFHTRNGWDLLSSDDEWVAPVSSKTGPDGAIWISDFYSFLVQHNPTPSVERGGFKGETGKGNAFISDLRDTQRARIWRLSWKGMTPSRQWRLSKDDPETLLSALKSDNLLWRMHAQRLLVERGKDDVAPQLKTLAADPSMDEIGVSAGAFHALWTLNGLGAADFDTVVKALKHPAQGVRRAALKILPSAPQSAQAILDVGLLKDPEPLVRLTALLALADQPPSDLVGAELFKLNNDPSIAKDQWLPAALTIAATRHSNGFLASALAAALPLAAGQPAEKSASVNLVQNGGFEEIENGAPKHWKPATFGGSAEQKVETKGRNGGNCVTISSPKEVGADTAWATQLSLEENTDYLLSAWIKTENVRAATGALLEIHQAIGGRQPRSKPVTGVSDWQQVSFKISTGARRDFQLNCLFGGRGRSTGKAWFADVSCVKLGPTGAAANKDGIVDLLAVSRTFARVATPTQLTALNVLLASKPSVIGRTISEGLRNPSKPKVAENMTELAKTHQIVNIKAEEGLKYDVLNVTVKSGRPIALVFQDADQLQHNLVITRPGALEKCCMAADVQAGQPDAIQKNYIPSVADILHATKLLNPGDIEILKFELNEPGEYPYFCTFPGHCHIMRGTLKVVP